MSLVNSIWDHQISNFQIQYSYLLSDSVQIDPLGAVVIVWKLDLQLLVQSVHITTNVVSWNPINGEVYLIQHYVIKFVSDLRQVGGFLCTLVSSINKTDPHKYHKYHRPKPDRPLLWKTKFSFVRWIFTMICITYEPLFRDHLSWKKKNIL